MVDQTETFLRCTKISRNRSSFVRAAQQTHPLQSTAPSRVRGCVCTQEASPPKFPSMLRARNLARAIDHQRRQEQHAMDSSLLAAMASAGDESPGGDGTMNGDGLRAPLGTPMSLRQDGAHASRMAPHSAGAQQMVLGASPRAAATSLPARVLHEAYGTGTALGGAMGDASTAGDSATGGAKAAASRATEDMHTLIRALKTDLSCMSVRLERLEALLSA